MPNAFIVFPHQLFSDLSGLDKYSIVVLIEDPLFFGQYAFHRQKLHYHRATMQAYRMRLINAGCKVMYIESQDPDSHTSALLRLLKGKNIDKIELYDPEDYLLSRRLLRHARSEKISIRYIDSPNFLCTTAYFEEYFKGKKRFHLTSFYIDQRKRLGILTDTVENPVGGKWTFDTENRKKLPAGTRVPPLPKIEKNEFISEADDYVLKNFHSNPGVAGKIKYPVTHEEASDWLDSFLKERFHGYGDYQDAIEEHQSFLFHSIISPMLNTGLLNPADVLQRAVETANAYGVPMNALEGFIRQVLGWREFVRIVYRLKGVQQRTTNFWGFNRKIPRSFYEGNTGIPPLDDVIRKTLETGYAHHIERLMVLGNFMILCEFDPDEVYKWFMEMYIDAYDWVMVPNVYGMSQFADGGLMSTKPYISGSNYILKMSSYKKGDWCGIWDALYWRFIYLHKEFFLKNPRMSMMVRQVEKMERKKFDHLMLTAEKFLDSLH